MALLLLWSAVIDAQNEYCSICSAWALQLQGLCLLVSYTPLARFLRPSLLAATCNVAPVSFELNFT